MTTKIDLLVEVINYDREKSPPGLFIEEWLESPDWVTDPIFNLCWRRDLGDEKLVEALIAHFDLYPYPVKDLDEAWSEKRQDGYILEEVIQSLSKGKLHERFYLPARCTAVIAVPNADAARMQWELILKPYGALNPRLRTITEEPLLDVPVRFW